MQGISYHNNGVLVPERVQEIEGLFPNGIPRGQYIKFNEPYVKQDLVTARVDRWVSSEYLREFKFELKGPPLPRSISQHQDLTGMLLEGEGCFIKVVYVCRKMFSKLILGKIGAPCPPQYKGSSTPLFQRDLEHFSDQEIVEGLRALSESYLGISLNDMTLSESRFAIFARLYGIVEFWKCHIITPTRKISSPLGMLQHFYSLFPPIPQPKLEQMLPLNFPCELKTIIVNYLGSSYDLFDFLKIKAVISRNVLMIRQSDALLSSELIISFSSAFPLLWLCSAPDGTYLSLDGSSLEKSTMPDFPSAKNDHIIFISDDEWSRCKNDKFFLDKIFPCFRADYVYEGSTDYKGFSPEKMARFPTPKGMYYFIGQFKEKRVLFVYPQSQGKIDELCD